MATTTWIGKSALGAEDGDTRFQRKGNTRRDRGKKVKKESGMHSASSSIEELQ